MARRGLAAAAEFGLCALLAGCRLRVAGCGLRATSDGPQPTASALGRKTTRTRGCLAGPKIIIKLIDLIINIKRARGEPFEGGSLNAPPPPLPQQQSWLAYPKPDSPAKLQNSRWRPTDQPAKLGSLPLLCLLLLLVRLSSRFLFRFPFRVRFRLARPEAARRWSSSSSLRTKISPVQSLIINSPSFSLIRLLSLSLLSAGQRRASNQRQPLPKGARKLNSISHSPFLFLPSLLAERLAVHEDDDDDGGGRARRYRAARKKDIRALARARNSHKPNSIVCNSYKNNNSNNNSNINGTPGAGRLRRESGRPSRERASARLLGRPL